MVITSLFFLDYLRVIFRLFYAPWFCSQLCFEFSDCLMLYLLFVFLGLFFFVLHVYFCLFSTSSCNASSAWHLDIDTYHRASADTFCNICCFCSFTWGFVHVKHSRQKALFDNCMHNIWLLIFNWICNWILWNSISGQKTLHCTFPAVKNWLRKFYLIPKRKILIAEEIFANKGQNGKDKFRN